MDAQRHIDSLPVRKWDGIGLHTRWMGWAKEERRGTRSHVLPAGAWFASTILKRATSCEHCPAGTSSTQVRCILPPPSSPSMLTGADLLAECVDEWLANNKSCPTCKASIISDECGVCGDGDPMVDAAIGGAAAGADSSTTA